MKHLYISTCMASVLRHICSYIWAAKQGFVGAFLGTQAKLHRVTWGSLGRAFAILGELRFVSRRLRACLRCIRAPWRCLSIVLSRLFCWGVVRCFAAYMDAHLGTQAHTSKMLARSLILGNQARLRWRVPVQPGKASWDVMAASWGRLAPSWKSLGAS